MLRNLEKMVLSRIVVFFVSLFLVLNALFFLVFVLEPRGVIYRPMESDMYQIIADELKLEGSLTEQYVNFMGRMLSGDFFTSLSVETHTAISDFIYDDALLTVAHFLVVIVLSIVAGGIYAKLANRWLPGYAGKAMFALAAVVAVTSAWVFFYSIAWMLSQLDERLVSEGYNMNVVSCAFFPVAAASVLVLEKTMRSNSADRGNLHGHRLWREMSDPFLAGVMPFLIVSAMTIVLIAETMFARGGMGYTTLTSIYSMDLPCTVVCIYIFSIILLTIYLMMDMIFIYARSREEGRPPLEKTYRPPSDDGIPERIGLPSLSQFWKAYSKSKIGVIAAVGLLALLCAGLASPLLATVQDPNDWANLEPNTPYGSDLWRNPHPPSLEPSPVTGYVHPLGTDHFGRDVYSILLYDTTDSLSVAFLIAAFAIGAAVLVGFSATSLSRNYGSLARPSGWLALAVSDMILAAPMFLILGLAFVTNYFDALLFLILFAWVWAPLGRTAATRLAMLSIGNGNQEHRRVFSDSRTIAGLLRTGKFCFLFTYMTIALTSEFLLSRESGLDFGWADSLWDAYQFGALYAGDWWMVIPAAVMIGLLAVLVFAVLDRAERILDRWPGDTSDSSKDISIPDSPAANE